MRHNSKKHYKSTIINKKRKLKHKVQPLEIWLKLVIYAFNVSVFINAINWKNVAEADNTIIHQENKVEHGGDAVTNALSTILLDSELVDVLMLLFLQYSTSIDSIHGSWNIEELIIPLVITEWYLLVY